MNDFIARLSQKLSAVATVTFIALFGALVSYPVFAQQAADEAVASVTEPLGETYTEPKKLAPNVVRVTFYRPAHGYAAGVSSLQINDHYHTSLQFGSYSELCLPPGRISLAAHMVQTGGAIKNFQDATAAQSITAGQNVYFRINEYGDNRATITPVTATLAQTELKNTRRQAHVVSRVPNTVDCMLQEQPTVKKESIVLGADALFAFGKSDIQGISPQGRASLDALIAHLQKEYANQESVQIQIAGHADPLGNPASNKRLSEARAQAIRTYMVNSGMTAKNITGVGIGSAQPVITTCGKTATPEAIECNKPNRRVVVGVQAVAR
jgi:OOP family OmpA-OmpF porin